MAWVPGAEKYFNQPVGTGVYKGLGAAVIRMETTENNPGLFQARYDDAVTLSLLVRPRLQNFASKGVAQSAVVEDVKAKLGYG
jgi:hypothetical protein